MRKPARRGKLLLEEYFHGYSEDVPHPSRSAGKSLTTTLIGMAVHQGIVSLDIPVYSTMKAGTPMADLDPKASRMQLQHLITMTPGWAAAASRPYHKIDDGSNAYGSTSWWGFRIPSRKAAVAIVVSGELFRIQTASVQPHDLDCELLWRVAAGAIPAMCPVH